LFVSTRDWKDGGACSEIAAEEALTEVLELVLEGVTVPIVDVDAGVLLAVEFGSLMMLPASAMASCVISAEFANVVRRLRERPCSKRLVTESRWSNEQGFSRSSLEIDSPGLRFSRLLVRREGRQWRWRQQRLSTYSLNGRLFHGRRGRVQGEVKVLHY